MSENWFLRGEGRETSPDNDANSARWRVARGETCKGSRLHARGGTATKERSASRHDGILIASVNFSHLGFRIIAFDFTIRSFTLSEPREAERHLVTRVRAMGGMLIFKNHPAQLYFRFVTSSNTCGVFLRIARHEFPAGATTNTTPARTKVI